MSARRAAAVLGVCAAALLIPTAALAQGATPRRPRPEARLDLLAASRSALHAGLGLELPVGSYARIEGLLAAGPRFGPGGPTASARGDALVRFVPDPVLQLTRTPYGAAGLSVRRERGRTRGDLVALLGLQLRPRGAYVPAVELGFGGGVRVGVVLRRAR